MYAHLLSALHRAKVRTMSDDNQNTTGFVDIPLIVGSISRDMGGKETEDGNRSSVQTEQLGFSFPSSPSALAHPDAS